MSIRSLNKKYWYPAFVLSVAVVGAVCWILWLRQDSKRVERSESERVEPVVQTEPMQTGFVEVEPAEAVIEWVSNEEESLPVEARDWVELKLEDAQLLELKEEHAHTLGRWLGKLSPRPIEWPGGEGGFGVSFRTPDGEDLKFVMDQSENYGPRKGLRAGHVEGKAFSEVIVSYVNDSIAGVIRVPSESVAWELRNKGEGVVEFEKVDLSKLKGCLRCAEKH